MLKCELKCQLQTRISGELQIIIIYMFIFVASAVLEIHLEPKSAEDVEVKT